MKGALADAVECITGVRQGKSQAVEDAPDITENLEPINDRARSSIVPSLDGRGQKIVAHELYVL